MNDFIAHFGIQGMKWGVRRYQNPDGTLTEEGRKRYYSSDGTLTREGRSKYSKDLMKAAKKSRGVTEEFKSTNSSNPIITELKDKLKNSKQSFDEADKKWEQAENKFWRNEDEVVKYAKIAAKNEAKYLDDREYDWTNGGMTSEKQARKDAEQWFIDQGRHESKTGGYTEQYIHDMITEAYLKDKKNVVAKQAHDDALERYLEYERDCNKYVNKLLGEYSGVKINEYGMYGKLNYAVGRLAVGDLSYRELGFLDSDYKHTEEFRKKNNVKINFY